MMTLPVACKKTSVKGILRPPVMQLLSIATHETAIGNTFHYNDVKQNVTGVSLLP